MFLFSKAPDRTANVPVSNFRILIDDGIRVLYVLHWLDLDFLSKAVLAVEENEEWENLLSCLQLFWII